MKTEMVKTALLVVATAVLLVVTTMLFVAASGMVAFGYLFVLGQVVLVFVGLISFSGKKPESHLEAAERAFQAVLVVLLIMIVALVI